MLFFKKKDFSLEIEVEGNEILTPMRKCSSEQKQRELTMQE
nr:MAG TPA: hypothetical protein [Caudoviricetes sp.]